MPLDADSTLSQVIAEFKETSLYSIDGDVALAKRFVVACRMLIVQRPAMARSGNQQFEYSVAQLEQLKREADDFVKQSQASTGGANRTRYANFRNFRS